MIEELRELYAYMRWANGHMLDAVAQLGPDEFTRPLGSSFPSVRETLVHMLGAEWRWLERWHGRAPAPLPTSWDLSTLESIRRVLEDVERAQEAFVAGLTDADLRRTLSYRYSDGSPGQANFAQMLRHVVNHATYHRGQVTTMLRQLGAAGVDTDLITFYTLAPEGEAPTPAIPAD